MTPRATTPEVQEALQHIAEHLDIPNRDAAWQRGAKLLVQLYETTDKPEQAAEWKIRIQALHEPSDAAKSLRQ
jgi:hypothetical protein